MSKKTTKLLGVLAAASAAAGIYCWYKMKHLEDDFEDEFDEDFDAEEVTEDFEIDEDLKDVTSRGYTTLTPSPEEPTSESLS